MPAAGYKVVVHVGLLAKLFFMGKNIPDLYRQLQVAWDNLLCLQQAELIGVCVVCAG